MRKYTMIHSLGVAAFVFSSLPAPAQTHGAQVSGAIEHDVSLPLANMPPLQPKGGPRAKPVLPLHPDQNATPQPDPVVQTSFGSLAATTSGLNFAGVGNGDYGFAPNAAPPDTNGAVGATQYVQWVNESFAVFDKATGAKVYGPAAGNTLWSGFGGGCQNNNDGDPIVQYDKAANRWIFTQFSVSTTPYLQCIAVSTTSDATGTYNRYSFSYTNFPDYPKLGVWPDAYYITFNMFQGNFFAGSRLCAYNRAAMLAGSAATQQCFQLSSSFGGVLPSDLDGSTPPAAGTPNFMLNFGTNSLNLWKFHVDWTTPANTSLTGPTNIPVGAFSQACSGGACIPQPGTNQKLDSLADRLMYRLAYRKFSDHEALLANHSVGSPSGVRWYELRNVSSAPTVFQQGTYAPDSSYRWMGSIAMDQSGNIALGYSVSSGTLNPSIRYTGRVPTDALGTMQAENTILTGGGSQLTNLSRWGDYSSMSVDPVDDCTFWFTTEYLKASGTFNWSTRIASFKFPNCGGTTTPVHDVAVSSVSAPSPVVVNTAQTVTVSVQNLGTQAESFTVSLSDPQSTITSTPQSVTNLGAGASQNLTFGWTPSTTGTHTLVATASTVTGETSTANNTAQTTSTVNAVSAGPPTISSISPTSMAAGSSTTSFTITGTNFVSGATVTFVNGNGPAPTASSVVVNATGTGITATVNVPSGGAPRNRVWDVRVTNPNGQSATLAKSFTVTP
jgi:hypothetical protein